MPTLTLLTEALAAMDRINHSMDLHTCIGYNPEYRHPMEIHITSMEMYITFLNETIWSSENDTRKWYDGKYEPLSSFLVKKCNLQLKALRKIKLVGPLNVKTIRK